MTRIFKQIDFFVNFKEYMLSCLVMLHLDSENSFVPHNLLGGQKKYLAVQAQVLICHTRILYFGSR